jgi:predicted RNase H-like HicB family nuclease
MKNEYTAVIKQIDDWWIGWIKEVPGVNCQEKSYEALRETLETTLQEALEFNSQEALSAAGSGFREEIIAV